jgi:DNA-binding beta-propeller fold protein YncE
VGFESGEVRPLALSPDGTRLFAVNTPDDWLEIFDVTAGGLVHRGGVPVGLEPVAVAARSADEVWVVNHVSDSVSIVDVGADPPRVVRTLLVGDEPRDVVFAGLDRRRAFITTAHRGQNSPVDPELGTAGVGRADVWVFDAGALGTSLGGDPLAILTLFGDTPRALAASPDGAVVYAAVFQSGNRTATVPASAVCDGGAAAGPCDVEGVTMPGGLPAPNVDADGVPQPEVGLIARFDAADGTWKDTIGRSWNAALRFTLPDLDVFAIDARADPPVGAASFAGVGTVLYSLAVNPASGTLYVANTEARNDVRFSGLGRLGWTTVRGHLHETHVTVIDPTRGTVAPRHLNKHIDYGVVPSPPGTAERSLSLPVGLAVSGDGRTLWVAALGSDAIGVFDTAALADDTFVPDASTHIVVPGGPSGLVLDDRRGRLYVLTRFDDAVAVVDTTARREVQRIALHDPEPSRITLGRRFLYDARYTSSNGEAACASCHVFGDVDGLAWDLGDPDGSVVNNPLRLRNAGGAHVDEDFHPLKGPMTTQTLHGIATHGSMHWRGDRTGGNDPGGDPEDEVAAFLKFNPAFDQLLGRGSSLDDTEMRAFGDFVLALTLPPNPIRALDNALDAEQQAGEQFFFGDGGCSQCHTVDPARGFFGTDGAAAIAADRPQFMKIPHLRTVYQKIGRGFGTFSKPPNAGMTDPMGDQIRGFGFTHDGAVGALLGEPLPFLMAFVTNLAPIVGQQVTLAADTAPTAAARIDLLLERAAAGECDVVAKGVLGGLSRGWYRTAEGTFRSDRAAEAALDDAALRALAAVPGQAITYTAVPPGTGVRIGVDRDADGAWDRDELDAGSDPADPLSRPGQG